jgi:hypothetical protein
MQRDRPEAHLWIAPAQVYSGPLHIEWVLHSATAI